MSPRAKINRHMGCVRMGFCHRAQLSLGLPIRKTKQKRSQPSFPFFWPMTGLVVPGPVLTLLKKGKNIINEESNDTIWYHKCYYFII